MTRKIEGLINMKNVVTVYTFSKLCNLQNIFKQSSDYIESCITRLADDQSFSDLDYSLVAKILASSELQITSELEVCYFANKWLSYNFDERKKHAKQLLSKIRLDLMSEQHLKSILKEFLSFVKVEECVDLLKKVLKNKKKFKVSSSSKHRCCNHGNFNFILCGGLNLKSGRIVSSVNQFNGSTLAPMKALTILKLVRRNYEAVCIKDEIYIFGGINTRSETIYSVDRYSAVTKRWKFVADMQDDREDYCISAYMDQVFIIAGEIINGPASSCLRFNTKNYEWKTAARTNIGRFCAASILFEGKIVVSGGWDQNYEPLNSVESYDVSEDRWLPMAAMIKPKLEHKQAVVHNKLFVIGLGKDNCEVFDNISRNFVALKNENVNLRNVNGAISIGNMLYVFQNRTKIVFCYDVVNCKWTTKTFLHDISYFSCLKVPWF